MRLRASAGHNKMQEILWRGCAGRSRIWIRERRLAWSASAPPESDWWGRHSRKPSRRRLPGDRVSPERGQPRDPAALGGRAAGRPGQVAEEAVRVVVSLPDSDVVDQIVSGPFRLCRVAV